MKPIVYSILVLVLIFIASFNITKNTINKDYNPQKSHHTNEGFINRYSNITKKDGLLKWQWDRFINNLPKPPKAEIQGISPNFELINDYDKTNKITWIGHSTVLAQIDGINILTDPHWGDRASPVNFAGPKRHQKAGIPFDKLPNIDAVVISHNHYDHLDKGTIQKLIDNHAKIKFFVPLGVQYWFESNIAGSKIKGQGANVIALDWDDSFIIHGKTDDISLHFLSVQHWSARSMWDRNETLWGSWAIIHPKFKFWFSGDLGYSKDTKDIGARFGGFDVAAIAIGAYEPRWFMKHSHINPEEAVKVMDDVNANSAIAIHWGTFENMSDESLDTPPVDLEKALSVFPIKKDFKVIKHGETIVY